VIAAVLLVLALAGSIAWWAFDDHWDRAA